ncbi:MAG: hypothetical protein ACK2TS_01675 [Anaerolineales bacterium]
MDSLKVGYMLRSGTMGFVAGCPVSQSGIPPLGSLLCVPLLEDINIFGIIYDINVADDGLIRQLVTVDNISTEVIRDNRERRIIPMEMSVVTVGWEKDDIISHLLPPRPPLSLSVINQCTQEDLIRFTSFGNFGYFRHILRNKDLPVGEILAAHLQQAGSAHKSHGDPGWYEKATRELIVLLRDDYATLMEVLSTLGDAGLGA